MTRLGQGASHAQQPHSLTSLLPLCRYTFPEFFMPSEHVVRKGAVGKEMFFIYRGKCTVLANDNKSPLFTLKQGSFFGEIALVLNERRTASVIAASFCETSY